MTGRENVIFVSRIHGEDPRRVLAFVEDFAELGDYMNVPIRNYSSGMGARLAFGMSMAIPFDCYIVDEITASATRASPSAARRSGASGGRMPTSSCAPTRWTRSGTTPNRGSCWRMAAP